MIAISIIILFAKFKKTKIKLANNFNSKLLHKQNTLNDIENASRVCILSGKIEKSQFV